MVDRHHDAAAFERATTLAATHAQTPLQYLGIGGDDAHLFQLLANYLIYHDAGLRAPAEVLERDGRPEPLGELLIRRSPNGLQDLGAGRR